MNLHEKSKSSNLYAFKSKEEECDDEEDIKRLGIKDEDKDLKH